MELKNGSRRELLVVGGILFGATLIFLWFLTNLYFDRWSTGTFSPTPLLPYPVAPDPTSFNSGHWTGLFYLYLIIGVPLAVVFIGELFYVAWKYRDHPGRKIPDSPEKMLPGVVPRSHAKPRNILYLNIFVAVILFSLTAYSLPLNSEMVGTPPHDSQSLTINVIAFQWGWKFVYPDNSSSIGSVVVPINEEIIFRVTSTDVMHDFAIPSLAVKVDAYPKQVNTAWTTIYKTGNYEVFCMELCGVGHADMIATLTAVPLLQSVAVTPSSSTVSIGGSATFTATPTCAGGPCASGLTYTWTTANSRGNLSSSTGPSTTFTAGPSSGSDSLFVSVSLYGVPIRSAAVPITIGPTAQTRAEFAPWYPASSGS